MQFYRKFQALGSEFEVYLCREDGSFFETDFRKIHDEVYKFEQSFSRFLPDSEICRLNKSKDFFKASPELIDIMKKAKIFHLTSKGIFNPTILGAMQNIGYDRSFPFSRNIKTNQIINIKNLGNFNDVVIDENAGTIKLPINTAIDLGGIGKGYLVDKITKLIVQMGYNDFWLSAGGDMFLSGPKNNGKPHLIGVQNPLKLNEILLELEINRPRGIATSGIGKRQWRIYGKKMHHIIDPKKGLPVNNSLRAATVIAKNTTTADIFAKTALILGKEAGIDFLNHQEDLEGLLIDNSLNIFTTKKLHLTNYPLASPEKFS